MRRASLPDPRYAIRVTGGEREPAAATPKRVAPVRQLAEAPEPSAPKADPVEAREAAIVAMGIDPQAPVAPQGTAPEKPQNGGNRLVKALGKVFHKRPKPDTAEDAKTPLRKD